MKKMKYLLAIVLAIPACVLIAMGISATDSSGYAMVSNKTSPSGQLTVFEIESISEAGHAPYGRHLVLSEKKFVQKPDDGYVLFAGYCLSPLAYEWKGDDLVSIQCKADEKKTAHTRTRADIALGVKVEVQYVQ